MQNSRPPSSAAIAIAQLSSTPSSTPSSSARFDEGEARIMKIRRDSLLGSIEIEKINADRRGAQLYYPNQKATADAVARGISLNRQTLFHLVCGFTQCGKTGCMVALIEAVMKSEALQMEDVSSFKSHARNVNPQNIFVITGLSSKEWRLQTGNRLPQGVKALCRGDLKKLAKRIVDEQLRDILIIIDEVHVASKEGMTLDAFIDVICDRDTHKMSELNVSIVQFDATPNRVHEDLGKWGRYSKEYKLVSGEGYKGLKELLRDEQVRQAKDLYIAADPQAGVDDATRAEIEQKIKPAYEAIKELRRTILTKYRGNPKNHIIRTPSGAKGRTVVDRCHEIFGKAEFDYVNVDAKHKDTTVIQQIGVTPTKHTIIFIKEHLRCAVTLTPKQNIGILYERIAAILMDDVMVQGLAGRATGYDVPDHMLVYTNIRSLELYRDMWNGDANARAEFSYAGKKGKQKLRTLYCNEKWSNTGLDSTAAEEPQDEQCAPEIVSFNTQEEAKEYWKSNIRTHESERGPQKRQLKGGFYEACIRGQKRVYSETEVMADIMCGLGKTNKWRLSPCYVDVSDENTIKWLLINKSG